VPVVLLASEAEVTMAVEAMRHGATDFIEKAQVDISLLRRVSQLLRNGPADVTRDARPVTR
jgi:FixJ family two-component response regulator